MKPSTRTILLSALDQDARDWAARVASSGGTVSGKTKKAVSEFCKAAKASGYWSKLTRLNLFCGGQLAAALVPLKVGGGNATDTNTGPFVAGDYAESTGLTGNGTTKYLRTGVLANSLTANSTHLAVYNRSGAAAGGGIHIGTRATPNFFELLAPMTDGSVYSRQYDDGTGRVISAVTAPYGLIVGSRTAAGAHANYEAGVSIGSNATSGGSLIATEIYVFGANAAGVVSTPVSHTLAGYSIGAGLTATDVAAYNAHMEAFQDALGRGVQ